MLPFNQHWGGRTHWGDSPMYDSYGDSEWSPLEDSEAEEVTEAFILRGKAEKVQG